MIRTCSEPRLPTPRSTQRGQRHWARIREDCLDDDKINIFKARVFKDFKYPKPLYVVGGRSDRRLTANSLNSRSLTPISDTRAGMSFRRARSPLVPKTTRIN